MNFKVFGAARNRNSGALAKPKSFFLAPHKRQHEGIIIELSAFSEALAKAIDDDNLNDFIKKTFIKHNEFESEKVLVESFADFFQNFSRYCNEDEFFPIFYSICLNHNLLKEESISDILALACIAFFNCKINVYQPSFSMLYELVQNVPLPLIEEAVNENMVNILEDTNLRLADFSYLTYFNSWRQKICDNFEVAIRSALSFQNGAEKFIQLFPEYAPQVYEYIFEKVITDDAIVWEIVGDDHFDFIDNVLKSMADYEKYQGYYFKIIREKVAEVFQYLSVHGKYHTMYYTADFLIEEFGICEEEVIELFKRHLYESIDGACERLDIISIERLLSIAEAYDYILEDLPFLLSEHGILLYAQLIKLLGPIPAITSKEFCCRQYIEQ